MAGGAGLTVLGVRPALRPTLFTLPALAALIALGTWQLERLAWKNGLIATMESRLGAPAVDLPLGPVAAAEWDYRRVRVAGRFVHDREIHLAAIGRNGQHGFRVITPLSRRDGSHVLIDRGWVPSQHKEAVKRSAGQTAGEVTVSGIVRKPWRQGWFVPDNDAPRNVWFYGDAAAMRRALGIAGPDLFVAAAGEAIPGGWPLGGQTRLDIPNNHLQYALIWYGFAVALAAIYVLWHWRERREQGDDRV